MEVGTHEPRPATAVHHRALACRAYWTAAGGRPGPVHLNFPLREPLAPVPEELEPPAMGRAAPDGPAVDRGARALAARPHADDVQDAGRAARQPSRAG